MSSTQRHVITPSFPGQGCQDDTVPSSPPPRSDSAILHEENIPAGDGSTQLEVPLPRPLSLSAPHRIQPTQSAHDLEHATTEHSMSDDDEGRVDLGQDLAHRSSGDSYASDHSDDLYLPGFNMLGQRVEDDTGPDETAGPDQTSANQAAREGGTSRSAIIILDSPTPPLRPLASPEARMVASVSGRCGILDGNDRITTGAEADKQVTMGDLVCPVCLGPPTPLVVTVCGHTFCGPCLHASITNQTITPQLLQEIPGLTGKDLEGTCPVCRTVLAGGWCASLRGAIIKMDDLEVEL